jgi:thioredoxin-related protein
MRPVVATMKKKCSHNITFIDADIDEKKYKALASEYRVSSIPRYVLLDPSGKVVRQWAGTTSEKEFDNTMGKICVRNP